MLFPTAHIISLTAPLYDNSFFSAFWNFGYKYKEFFLLQIQEIFFLQIQGIFVTNTRNSDTDISN